MKEPKTIITPRKRALVVTGVVQLPPTILAWERELVAPALGALADRSRRDGTRPERQQEAEDVEA